jgi:hypothetical protein
MNPGIIIKVSTYSSMPCLYIFNRAFFCRTKISLGSRFAVYARYYNEFVRLTSLSNLHEIGWEVTQPWMQEDGVLKKGLFVYDYYTGEGKGLNGARADLNWRHSMLKLVLFFLVKIDRI